MANLSSENVQVFPAALRANSTSLYTTENNISNIVRMSTSKYSFVDLPKSGTAGTYNISLVIHGYMFNLLNVTLVSGTNKYAAIRVNSNGMLVNYSDGTTQLDSGGNATFIELFDTIDTSIFSTEFRGEYQGTINGNAVYALKLFDGTNIVNTDKVSVSSLDVSNVGSTTTPVYFDDNGVPKPCTEVVAAKLGQNTVGTTNQPIWLNKGTPQAVDFKIVISDTTPTTDITSNTIWLKPMNTAT